ncbi:carbohydrate ABC transporter permease [Leadbettera azotonutricia]|uniref:Sugar ABC transporter, permease protein n=1 Tax=Leadbettera azotonutricia (strain ATCC BAA-888 / DSM 13862 / ZAS-9) TaxID=545695 RepID=F5Y899_LEAAZ|nr:carbohydrate ABC transporter permease [Leadbettera azotonutricia]AEF80253.1 sugar ABC transporter, permease protein [Leadbettera azotonutricia ZAS-9]
MKTNRSINFFIYLALIIMGIIMVFPFLWMLTTSLKPASEVFLYPPKLFPQNWQFKNYIALWNAAPFGQFYINNIIVSIAITVGQLITCSLGAYAFSRLKFKGRDKLFLLYLATLMIPFQVTMIPIYSIIKTLKLINTLKAIIVPSLFSAYGTFLLRQFFMTIPGELEESVKIDGGGYFLCYIAIIIPLSKTALATLGTFVFLFAWNNFLWPMLVINTLSLYTLPLGITFFQGRYGTQWNMLMGTGIITMMPLLIVYIFAQRFFISGLTVGAVKG